MSIRRNWTREELILAFNLYCKIEFGKINSKNPSLISLAGMIDRTPSAVSWKLVNFASLDPYHIARGVRGASNASKQDKSIFQEFTNNWEELSFKSESLLSKYSGNELEIFDDEFVLKEGKEKFQLIKTRVNQAFFRKTVLAAYNNKCCITGIDIPELLIASHIIPWAKNTENRLNPQNGLCLNNLHDQAFDKGLISFDSDLRLLLSDELKSSKSENIDKYFISIEGKQMNLPKRFLPDESFLEYHYNNIFHK